MTDRHSGYLVTLARDMREDDAEAIITALRMVRGVESVTPVQSNGLATAIGVERERKRIGAILDEAVRELWELSK